MILLRSRVLEGVTAPRSAQDLWPALQQAVELEHATIPVYLYALYSLDAVKNAAIAQILQSVVVEEMLHMTLASNVLNALGGSPVIDKPAFIPIYPGPLPGGVESDLVVSLAPFSMTQLETFLDIEAPENPLDFQVRAARAAADQITIGEFYTAILEAIELLGDGGFAKPPRNQIGPDLMSGSVVVQDVASARQAIQTIIVQGEGTNTSPEEAAGSTEPAHYYRFMQIQKGKLLVPTPPPESYAYAGAPVPFDPSGVYAVPADPKAAHYAPGSQARFLCDNFNYTYTSLLAALHALFNGANTSEQFNIALGLMMSLKGQAKAMMAGIPNPAVPAGPSFEYLAVNP